MAVAHNHTREDPLQLRSTAVSVATQVAKLASSNRPTLVTEVGTKSSETDVVTAGDTAAERLARKLLQQLRPGEPVFGEEEGGRDDDPERLCWVIDPIDGTVNYLYGYPWYAVSVAAQRGDVSIAGAVAEPSSGRVFSAARGYGADCDGTALAVSDGRTLAHALIGTGFSYRAERRQRQAEMVSGMLPRVRDIRRSGSAALDLCAVASGWLDGFVEHGLQRWDWAAGLLIAKEAGAVVRRPIDEYGHDELGDLTVAATPGVADALHDMLVECGAGKV